LVYNRRMNFYTYIHRRESDNAIFYVGKGRGRRAWLNHGRNSRWNRTVAKHGHKVEICAEWTTEAEAIEHEIFLISCFRDMGCQLVNMTAGGEGMAGYSPTPETRKKISIASKRTNGTPEAKLRSSLLATALHDTPEKRARLKQAKHAYFAQEGVREVHGAKSKAGLNKPEAKKKHLEAMRAIAQDKLLVEKRTKAIKKYWESDENRARQSTQIKAMHAIPENKKKHGDAVRAVTSTAAYRKKMSEVHKEIQSRPEVKAQKSKYFSSVVWINNGVVNKRIPSTAELPSGFFKGRVNFPKWDKQKRQGALD
jgi:hypothetical protein